MMSELSFSSTLSVSTPVAKSRRISMLATSHADLSSPNTAAEHLKLLELDNLALNQELEQFEAANKALTAENELLRSQMASSSSSSSQQVPMLSSSPSTDSVADVDNKQQLSAEKKATKRLLHRLMARIESYDPSSSSANADESRLFDLDQSLVHDPERSVIAPSSAYLTTPNGKTKVGRLFEGDLVDDIAALGGAFEEYARKAAFAATEQSVLLAGATSRNEKLSIQVQELESQLAEAHNASASASEKDAQIDQLMAELKESQGRESDLASGLEESESQISELRSSLDQTAAKLDQMTAEQELTISAAAKKFTARIEALQMQLDEQSSSTVTVPAVESDASNATADLESKLQTATEQLAQVQRERDATAQESEARIAALEAEVDGRRSKTSDLQSILTELQEKRERLHTIELHNSQIRSLERVLAQQERIVGLLERPADRNGGEEWMAYAQELSASLALLKTQAVPAVAKKMAESSMMTDAEVAKALAETSTMTDAEASKPATVDSAVMTDAEVDAEPTTQPAKVDDKLITELTKKVEELEGRVLRRNEQIGSLQRDLANAQNNLARTRTNQALGEETVKELEAEIEELQEQVKLLEGRNLTLEASSQRGEPQQLEQMDAATQAEEPEADTQKVQELQASLSSAQVRISALTTQLEELTASNTGLQAEKEILETTIATLTAQVDELQAALTASSEAATQSEEQQEQELSTLKSALRKSEDRLATTQLELDSLNLTLAEHRESSSEDADLIATLQTQLSTLSSQHALLTASSTADQRALEETRASINDLTTRFASVENEALSTRSELESKSVALSELVAKHAELEQVLAERDEAITLRNAEYWTLKEELAELQEEAERSRHDALDPAALSETQDQLAMVRREKVELEERISAQESALLRLKADLASARSTEEMLNEQYNASQRRAKDLELLVSQLESALPQETGENPETKEKLAKAEAEVEYLGTRIVELEEELGRKAEEIEEADSKILDALKESKKYATRYTKLSGKFEVLQKEVGKAEEKVKALEGELEREREKVKAARREQTRKEAEIVRSGSGSSLAGRKRAKPDSFEDDGPHSNHQDNNVDAASTPSREAAAVKAVYAPSPSHATARTPSSSFTPHRRSALSRSHAKPIVLGHGTPTASEGGMVRSTSNPSELIAARLSASPSKPLLGDKTNLAPAPGGGSRLSSKGSTETVLKSKVKGVTSLLPGDGARGEERKPPAVAGGGGPADFLAKMKAQRAQRA